jgi:hypothetical protein
MTAFVVSCSLISALMLNDVSVCAVVIFPKLSKTFYLIESCILAKMYATLFINLEGPLAPLDLLASLYNFTPF